MNPERKTALQLAFSWPVVRLALIMAAVVGTVLVSINHGACVFSGHFGFTCAWQSALTMMVPYTVSTVSSVLALLAQQKMADQ